jgi:hypothetical protein
MKKFAAGLLAGTCLLALTLITLLLDPSVFLQWRWKRISLVLAAVAIVCMVLQSLWTKQDEDEERGERERLYKLVRKVLKHQTEQARKHGHGKITLAFQAASCAEDLLNSLTRTPNTRKFDPVWDKQLFDQLEIAYRTGQEWFNQGQLLRPISRDEVFGQVERLMLLASDLEEGAKAGDHL